MAEEGGPGWPSSGSSSEYLGTFAPLLATRNLLLVDDRGTGRSGAIDCSALQHYHGSTIGRDFQRIVGRCGDRLNHTWKAKDGSWIHASDLFATGYAVHDLADILRAMDVTPVDLYGDSYGTWFVQSFLSHHADLLRSVVLESAYPMFGGDAWYRSQVWAERPAFRAACARDAACRTEASGDPWIRLGALVRRVRAHPLQGETVAPNGNTVHETVTPAMLVNLAANAGFDPLGYRELDAAVRAGLGGDAAPLLRLAAISDFSDTATPTDPKWYSDGLYFAVSCSEYDQLFDMQKPPAHRRRELAAGIRAEPRRTFHPFTPQEWTQMNAYSSAFTACLDWPKPDPDLQIKAQGHRPPLAPPSLPVLMLTGDLDSWTSSAFGTTLVNQVGPSSRFVLLANSVHTTGLDDTTSYAATACARSIIDRFIRRPAQLASLDTSCAPQIPPVHTVGSFPPRLNHVHAARLVGGRATLLQRRGVTAAAETLGDAFFHWYVADGSSGAGLHGGRWTGHGSGTVHIRLDDAQMVPGVRVSGHGTWHTASGAVRGALLLRSRGGLSERVRVSWNETEPMATARLRDATFRFPAP